MSVTFSVELRRAVYAKTEGHCAYCGILLWPDGKWHVDHMLPKAQGGTEEIGNLVPACPKCNLSKKDRTPEEFRHEIRRKILRHVGEAGQRLSDDTWLTGIDKAAAIALLIQVDTALSDAEVPFWMDRLENRNE